MKRLLFCILLFTVVGSIKAQEKTALYAWANFPFAKMDTIMPALTIFRPEGKGNGVGLIVWSGGSYGRRANQEEGIPACKRLAEAGITASCWIIVFLMGMIVSLLQMRRRLFATCGNMPPATASAKTESGSWVFPLAGIWLQRSRHISTNTLITTHHLSV